MYISKAPKLGAGKLNLVQAAAWAGSITVVHDILVERVHFILGVVQVVEQDPDQASSDETGNGEANVQPLDGRIVQHGGECLADSGTEGIGEEVDGLDE